MSYKISRGHPYPFGVSSCKEGLNFALVSTSAKEVSLCLFVTPDQIAAEIPLKPEAHKTGNVWHIALDGLPRNLLYLFRVDQEPLLLDPYARCVFSPHGWRGIEPKTYRPFGVLPEGDVFDWGEDPSPNIALHDLIIYEMHVRGFTVDPSSKVKHPGTYLGVIEKIPYLLDLGINAVELLPLFEFDETENTKVNPKTNERLCNFWGYSTMNFFSPMQRYASQIQPRAAITEFKTMVRELHRNGIEVILDVVYNHTGEGNGEGPTLSFKGLDNAVYYILDSAGHYANYTGCGNTFNCNHPVCREFILESLRYWVVEMHVDGFRFDLASIFSRGIHGEPLPSAPILEAITKDPILAKVKLISEPWDAVGLYQVGSFFLPGGSRWSEWNGRYRDIVRRFVKGTGYKGAFASSICGSQDLYYRESPTRSINFVTAHDGFTLADLVSYNRKHNLANGEENRDGSDNNDSWNCGTEGDTEVSTVLFLRERQMRNFHLALMISRGVPMLLMGDEYGHTKLGNNNTWCQDNELNWFLWNKLEENAGFYRFYKKMNHFRKETPLLCQNKFFAPNEIDWHSTQLLHPHWDKNAPFIALTLKDKEKGEDIYIAFNMGPTVADVELPKNSTTKQWYWIVNTANESPDDFAEDVLSKPVTLMRYQMMPHSAIMLQAHTR